MLTACLLFVSRDLTISQMPAKCLIAQVLQSYCTDIQDFETKCIVTVYCHLVLQYASAHCQTATLVQLVIHF
jgi:hypothetical protein